MATNSVQLPAGTAGGEREVTAVGAEDFAGEAEADAGGSVAIPGGIAAIEAFEDARSVGGGKAFAGIADGDDSEAGGSGEVHADEAAGAVVFECVIGQILQRLFEENGVRVGEDVRERLRF